MRPIITAIANRPHPAEDLSGDTWSIEWYGNTCRIAIIDGLGHGPEATRAALAAREVLAAQTTLPVVESIHACHEALIGTRGAALSMVLIDLDRQQATFAGVGNCETLIWIGGRTERPIAYRGIVGRNLPRLRTFEYAVADDWLLLLHTDGVSSRFDLTTLPAFAEGDIQVLAEVILDRWGRLTDDATVIVAKART